MKAANLRAVGDEASRRPAGHEIVVPLVLGAAWSTNNPERPRTLAEVASVTTRACAAPLPYAAPTALRGFANVVVAAASAAGFAGGPGRASRRAGLRRAVTCHVPGTVSRYARHVHRPRRAS
jgi:hypothetical protein